MVIYGKQMIQINEYFVCREKLQNYMFLMKY